MDRILETQLSRSHDGGKRYIPETRSMLYMYKVIIITESWYKFCGNVSRDVEFAGSSTFSWKLDPADRLLDPALDPAFSEKSNEYVENEFNQCQHYTAM